MESIDKDNKTTIWFKSVTWCSDRHLLFDSESQNKKMLTDETPNIG